MENTRRRSVEPRPVTHQNEAEQALDARLSTPGSRRQALDARLSTPGTQQLSENSKRSSVPHNDDCRQHKQEDKDHVETRRAALLRCFVHPPAGVSGRRRGLSCSKWRWRPGVGFQRCLWKFLDPAASNARRLGGDQPKDPCSSHSQRMADQPTFGGLSTNGNPFP